MSIHEKGTLRIVTTVYNAKCTAMFSILPLKNQKTRTLFDGDGTQSSTKKASGEKETEKPSRFIKKLRRQSQSAKTQPVPKKLK